MSGIFIRKQSKRNLYDIEDFSLPYFPRSYLIYFLKGNLLSVSAFYVLISPSTSPMRFIPTSILSSVSPAKLSRTWLTVPPSMKN